MNKLPKLKYPPIRASEDDQKAKETSRQLLNLLLSIDNATFEKVYPKTEQTHEI
jgi:hypothetical protein